MDYHVSFFSRKSLTRSLNKCNINLIKTIYDSNSSYRGEDLETIIAVGRVNNNAKSKNSEPNIFYEIISTFFSIIYKFLRIYKKFSKKQKSKVKALIKNYRI